MQFGFLLADKEALVLPLEAGAELILLHFSKFIFASLFSQNLRLWCSSGCISSHHEAATAVDDFSFLVEFEHLEFVFQLFQAIVDEEERGWSEIESFQVKECKLNIWAISVFL